jgi:hypothetical protein
MMSRASGGNRAPSWNPTRFCQRIPCVTPGTSYGPTPLTTPARVTRSDSSCAQARGVRPTTGSAENREPVEPERVGGFLDVAWPIEHRPVRLEVRKAVAGPVESDDAKAGLRRSLVGKLGLEPRAGMAVEVKPGSPSGFPYSQ